MKRFKHIIFEMDVQYANGILIRPQLSGWRTITHARRLPSETPKSDIQGVN